MNLSQKRADAVKNYLVSKGIADSKIQSKGYGKTKPIATNTTDSGREQNRRVEFTILKK
jgi:outer membrane protein OmpA-like peptidoglycan-associated protein